MTPQEQEAKSIRYVDALRVVALSDGNWAVFPLSGAIHPEIMETLSEPRLREMLSEQAKAYDAAKANIRLKPPAQAKRGVSVSLEDLFG